MTKNLMERVRDALIALITTHTLALKLKVALCVLQTASTGQAV